MVKRRRGRRHHRARVIHSKRKKQNHINSILAIVLFSMAVFVSVVGMQMEDQGVITGKAFESEALRPTLGEEGNFLGSMCNTNRPYDMIKGEKIPSNLKNSILKGNDVIVLDEGLCVVKKPLFSFFQNCEPAGDVLESVQRANYYCGEGRCAFVEFVKEKDQASQTYCAFFIETK